MDTTKVQSTLQLIKTAGTSPILMSVLGFFELILIIIAISTLSQLVGTKDTANDLTKTTLPAAFLLGLIVLIHTCLWYLYFTYNPMSMNLYFLVATSMCMIISLTALAISTTSRS